MGSRLKAAGIIDHKMPISYVFHYSKGPFEQVLDGIGYIYHKDKNPIFFEDISFLTYLKKQGYPLDQVMQDLKNPIMKFKTAEGVVEKNLINYTHGDSFETAFLKYKSRLPISTLASPI
jgi:hypothetical protein